MNTPTPLSLLRAHFLVALCAALFLVPSLVHADEMTFQINATGAQEVGAGDPDGFAIGMIAFKNGTGAGNTGSATISLLTGNINLSNLTGHHIHNAPAGDERRHRSGFR